jgi:hypothetical protein
MAVGDYRIGLDGKFLYGAAGATAGTEASNVDDVTLNLSARMAEAIRRGKKYVAKKPVCLECSVEFKIWDIEGDPFLTQLETAFFNKAKIALYPRDAVSGKGLDGDFYVSGFNRAEDNEEFITYTVTAEPTDEQRDPVWH